MKYNFKDSERLQIADFCCSNSLSYDFLEVIDSLRVYECIEIYAKAELIEDLFMNLINNELGYSFGFGVIDFEGSDVGMDYTGVYCMTVNDRNEIWIEPAYRYDKDKAESKLFYSEATLAYVYQEDCEQDLIDNLENCNVPTLLFGFDER